jgi:hypothetical protein
VRKSLQCGTDRKPDTRDAHGIDAGAWGHLGIAQDDGNQNEVNCCHHCVLQPKQGKTQRGWPFIDSIKEIWRPLGLVRDSSHRLWYLAAEPAKCPGNGKTDSRYDEEQYGHRSLPSG